MKISATLFNKKLLIGLGSLLSLLWAVMPMAPVFAASGRMYITPSPTVQVNLNTTLSVKLDTQGQPVDGAEAYLTYDTSKLQFISIDGSSSAFSIDLSSSGGSGTVQIIRSSFSDINGDVLIANVTFKALASSGSTPVSLTASSNTTYNGSYLNPTKQNATISFTDVPSPPTVTFSATPSSITQGQSSTLGWSTTNATTCSASGGWSGSKGISGPQIVTPGSTTSYTLTCSGPGGSANSTKTVTVTSPPPAPAVTFSATPATITQGQSSTLNWSTTNATACTASGGWSGSKNTSGSLNVSPTATTNYILTCSGTGGSANSTKTVTVNNPPLPTLTFSASPSSITKGKSSTLSWSTTNATACTASGGWTGTKSISGSSVLAPSSSINYTLSCSGTGGSVALSKSITVDNVPPPPLPPPITTPAATSNSSVTPDSSAQGTGADDETNMDNNADINKPKEKQNKNVLQFLVSHSKPLLIGGAAIALLGAGLYATGAIQHLRYKRSLSVGKSSGDSQPRTPLQGSGDNVTHRKNVKDMPSAPSNLNTPGEVIAPGSGDKSPPDPRK